MYDFHYNFIKKYFDAELLFTDTDSLTYDIYTYYLWLKKMLIMSFLSGKICLILIIIQKIKGPLMRLINKFLVKWKINLGELL